MGYIGTSIAQDDDFKNKLFSNISDDLLGHAIRWIQDNLNPEDVFEEKDLKDWAVENNYSHPDDRP